MLTILASLLGFFGPFVPELLKLFRQKQDNSQELAILKLQSENAAQAHTYKMSEINAQLDGNAQAFANQYDLEELKVTHAQAQSFGVQVLDAARDWNKWLVAPVFYLFALLDFINGMVRPLVTYAAVSFYVTYKYALFEATRATLGVANWQTALLQTWGENDWAFLMLVVTFWFGSRSAKQVFGGSASTGKTGGG